MLVSVCVSVPDTRVLLGPFTNIFFSLSALDSSRRFASFPMVFEHLLPFVSQGSSICKAAIHAGVVGADGGLVDVVALDKRKGYVGVLKNGIQSERCSSFSWLL